ncbi:MAG TPA: winged helix-turn-helix domain-containing protein [Chlamydiales bacterium]|nr:winged helix-turn-helix domain-containing protein [Chlamydiales bacterium]
MLKSLFGSKSAERILLFLLVNEQCYASQIQKAYGIALTPLQSILRKFEQAGILNPVFQGKKKLYRLNPNFPLIKELKVLLQKGFAHLPHEEKKHLFPNPESKNLSYSKLKRTALSLQSFWERIVQVQQMTIRTHTGEEAIGEVNVKEEKPGVLLFIVRGKWVKGVEQDMAFHNSLRWTFLFEDSLVRLEHLRHGPNHPIFLSHLAPITPRHLQSIDPHLCQGDCYFGRIEFSKLGIYMTWRILSGDKNETLHYVYI